MSRPSSWTPRGRRRSLRRFLAGCAALLAATGSGAAAAQRASEAAPEAAPEEPPPNYLRPALEIGAGLAAASIWYWVDDRNVLDWDNPSARERLNGEAWRFDNNTFALNYFWHPLAGAGMYVLGRGNRLGVAASLGYATVGSTLWEYVIEFKEKVSINDMLITPLGGLAVGEFFHKLAVYVSSVPPRTAGRQALAWTLGLSVHGHRQLDGLPPPAPPGLDRRGFSSELWSDLSLQYGFGVVEPYDSNVIGIQVLGFDGRFVALPGYLRPRSFERWFSNAEFASLSIDLDLGSPRIGADVFGETKLAGYHRQCAPAGPFGPVTAVTAGLGVAYTYRTTEAFGFDDRQGLLHAPGFSLEFQRRRGEMWTVFGLRGHPSFGSMSAPVYERWRTEHTDARTKTALQREGYFYGWGGSVMADARLSSGDIEIRADVAYGRAASIEGLDRAQERVTRDAHLTEESLRYRAAAWLVSESVPLDFGVVFERSQRRSRIENTTQSFGGQRVLAQLQIPL